MTAISYIKNSRDLQHLLTHPVVTTLLTLKWQLYSKFFYIHLVFHLIFQALITTYIILKFYNQETGADKIRYVCVPFITYMAFCEIAQFRLGPLHYIKLFFVNIMDLAGIVLSFLTCFFLSDENQSIIAPSIILLTFFKLFSLMSLMRTNFISMPLLMLFEVVRSVLKSSILLAVVAVFSLCFHLEFGDISTINLDNNQLNFDSIIRSFFKSIIMSTGEYEASEMSFRSMFGVISLFIFVIIVGISLFNLLTGQAVQDIQVSFTTSHFISYLNFFFLDDQRSSGNH